MADIHIHGTGDKIHIARADKLTPLERAMRTAVLFVAQSLMAWLGLAYLLPHRFNVAQSFVLVGLLFVAGEAWRGGSN